MATLVRPLAKKKIQALENDFDDEKFQQSACCHTSKLFSQFWSNFGGETLSEERKKVGLQ